MEPLSTMEQAVSQIQLEPLTIRSQIASRVHEDAPTPIDVNHRGSPKEFSGGILRCSDVGVGFRSNDGNDDDSDRSRVLADGFERGTRSA